MLVRFDQGDLEDAVDAVAELRARSAEACVRCSLDTRQAGRILDAKGRIWCRHCTEQQLAQVSARELR